MGASVRWGRAKSGFPHRGDRNRDNWELLRLQKRQGTSVSRRASRGAAAECFRSLGPSRRLREAQGPSAWGGGSATETGRRVCGRRRHTRVGRRLFPPESLPSANSYPARARARARDPAPARPWARPATAAVAAEAGAEAAAPGEPPGLDSGDLARAPPWSRAPGHPPRAAPPPPCSPLLSLGTGRWRRPSWLRRTRGGRPRREQRSAARRYCRACSAPPLRAHPGQPEERRAPRAKCSGR